MIPEIPREVEATARRLAKTWDLRLGPRLPGATCSLVLEAGEDRVLKAPFPQAEEAKAWHTVAAFSGHGGIAMLRHDPRSGALLMPRLRPGWNLTEVGLSDLDAVDVCAELILKLRFAPLVKGIPLETWHSGLESLPASSLTREAKFVYSQLLVDLPDPKLLHGDLHHFNILQDGARWVVIDPKGLVGDPSFEVAGFMRNPINEPPDSTGMRLRLKRFAEILGDPIERLWGWSFVETVSCSASPGGFDWHAAAQAIWEARP